MFIVFVVFIVSVACMRIHTIHSIRSIRIIRSNSFSTQLESGSNDTNFYLFHIESQNFLSRCFACIIRPVKRKYFIRFMYLQRGGQHYTKYIQATSKMYGDKCARHPRLRQRCSCEDSLSFQTGSRKRVTTVLTKATFYFEGLC